jgi:hypothetical protein
MAGGSVHDSLPSPWAHWDAVELWLRGCTPMHTIASPRKKAFNLDARQAHSTLTSVKNNDDGIHGSEVRTARSRLMAQSHDTDGCLAEQVLSSGARQ